MLHLDRIPLCLMAYAAYRALITLCNCQLQKLRESKYNNQINKD